MQTAMMLRCVDAAVNGSRGPFDVVDLNAKPEVHCHMLPGNCTNVDAARRFIVDFMASVATPAILLVTPSYDKFPDFDGFVCYKNQRDSAVMVCGYQVKLGRAYPKRDVPFWLTSGWLICGNAPDSFSVKDGWIYLDREAILSFLGYSLEPLCPSEWPEVSEVDEFD